MGLKTINIITENARVKSAETNKLAVAGIVPPLQKTFAEITYYIPTPTFFSRQCTVADEPERWNILGRFEWYLSGIYFTNQRRGEIMLAKLENFIAWLRAAARLERNKFKPSRTFWEISREIELIRIERQECYLKGDYAGAEKLALRVIACERELALELAEMRRAGEEIIR